MQDIESACHIFSHYCFIPVINSHVLLRISFSERPRSSVLFLRVIYSQVCLCAYSYSACFLSTQLESVTLKRKLRHTQHQHCSQGFSFSPLLASSCILISSIVSHPLPCCCLNPGGSAVTFVILWRVVVKLEYNRGEWKRTLHSLIGKCTFLFVFYPPLLSSPLLRILSDITLPFSSHR